MAMKGVYKSGGSASLSALPAGYLQAATLPGKHIAKGIEKWGEEIGGAIEEYYKAKQEGEFLGEQFEGLQEYLDDLTQPSGAVPGDWGAQAQDATNKKDLAKEIADFGKMSLAQKKAKVMDMKFRVDRFDKERSFGLEKGRFDLAVRGEDRAVRGEARLLQGQDDLRDYRADTLAADAEAARRAAEQNRMRNERSDENFRLRQDEAEAARQKVLRSRQVVEQDMAAIQTATGATPLPSGYAPGTREAAMFPIKVGMRMAGSPEMVAKIHALTPERKDPTMGQNLAGAIQHFDQLKARLTSVVQETGLPFALGEEDAPQKALVEVLARFGNDKPATEEILKAFNERFGGDESRIGQTFILPNTDQMAVWTSDGQIQLLYPEKGKGGVSVELQRVLGFQLEGDMVGDGARMVDALGRISQGTPDEELRGRLISEFLELRKAARLAINMANMQGLSGVQQSRVKEIDKKLNQLENALIGSPTSPNAGNWNTEITKLTAERKKIHDAAAAAWSARSGRNPSVGGSTRTYNRATGNFSNPPPPPPPGP